jgi:hypothetical protein
VYPSIEFAFELDGVTGSPFDTAANDVTAVVMTPDSREVRVPAFFDGGRTWRARLTPTSTGRHALVRVTRNGRDAQPKAEKREAEAAGAALAGFVRRDRKDPQRLAFDNGTSYFPTGSTLPWSDKPEDLAEELENLAKSGANWARIRMRLADGSALDSGAANGAPVSIETARKWDKVLDAAEKHGIRLHLALLDSQDVSRSPQTSWDKSPFNRRNGGPLASPEEIFVSPRARALMGARMRYMVARWGHHTAIAAWEIVYEGEETLPRSTPGEITEWHREMVAELRRLDTNHHLITTATAAELPGNLGDLDLLQVPVPGDAQVVLPKADRPVIARETAPAAVPDVGILSTLTSNAAGAMQLAHRPAEARKAALSVMRSAAAFARESGLASQKGLSAALLTVDTEARAALEMTGSTTAAKDTEIPLTPQASFPARIGPGAASGFTLRGVAEAGEVTVSLGRAGAKGTKVTLTVNGTPAADRTISPADAAKPAGVLTAKVPSGSVAIRVDCTGPDTVEILRIRVSGGGPALSAACRAGAEFAAFWVRPAEGVKQAQGRLLIPGLKSGTYTVVWWDPAENKRIREESATSGAAGLSLPTGAVSGTRMGWAARSPGEIPAKTARPAKALPKTAPKT